MDATVEIVGDEYRISVTGSSYVMRKGLFRDHLWKSHGVTDSSMNAKDVMLSAQCGCTDLNLEEVLFFGCERWGGVCVKGKRGLYYHYTIYTIIRTIPTVCCQCRRLQLSLVVC